jgi:hypothetical protein
MSPAEFEPAIPITEQPPKQALVRATTGICKYSVLVIKMYSNVTQLTSYDVKLPNYLERIETHHEGLRINKCCKIQAKYTVKNTFIIHPTYFSVLPFVLKSLMMLDW